MLQEIPALDVEPDPNSSIVMLLVDNMPKGMRALVHEYGLAIVVAMIRDGYTNPKELKPVLDVWRERRQEQWLKTDYLKRRSV